MLFRVNLAFLDKFIELSINEIKKLAERIGSCKIYFYKKINLFVLFSYNSGCGYYDVYRRKLIAEN